MTDYEKKNHERFVLVHCKGLLHELRFHLYDLKQGRLMRATIDLETEVGNVLRELENAEAKEATE